MCRLRLFRVFLVIALIQLSPITQKLSPVYAQFNTDRLVMIGRSALYYEDYVLSIQYFNQAISMKPWLYEPWFFRGVAKFYLDDFRGAESDCSEAIERNPYVINAYELRGLCRINQKKYREAISDYDRALRYNPDNQGLWHNRILCLIQEKNYDLALAQIDTMSARWSKYARAYAMQAEVYLLKKDTTKAVKSLDKSLELDPYDGGIWAERAVISLARQKWKEGEDFLTKSIHLLPKHSGNYINRALTRFNQNNLRAAIRDYSKVIEEYPNFWFGLQHRASCYRRLGNTKQAELDEFRILKAQMDKHYGKQPRLSKKQMRKRSDIDPDKYNQLVVADEQEVEHEYKSDYRGRVQNRKTDVALLPMYALTFIQPQNSVKVDTPFENSVDAFNQTSGSRTIYLSCDQATVGESRMKRTFEYIDSLSTIIDQAKTTAKVAPLLLLRAVAYASIQNFDNAIDDLSICLQIDSTSSLAYWQRAVCQAKINEFNASEGTNIDLKSANVLGDLSDAIALAPQNSYLYYNRGNLYALRGDYQRAIADYSQALTLNQDLAEAWYNRGLSKIFAKHVEEGVEDLSKAGELGLYQAYSVIKKYREK